MAEKPLPPPFDRFPDRPFSFHPAIVGIEHNEWQVREASWSEVLIRNKTTSDELWIPRQYVGEPSRIEDPVIIVGLNRELEYKGGMLVPFKSRVLNMPRGGMESGGSDGPGAAPPRLGGRLATADKRVLGLVGVAIALFVGVYVIVVAGNRIGDIRGQRIILTTADQSYQNLTGRDDRFGVVSKLGNPGYDRFKEVGGIQYEALSYPSRKYTVLMMGENAKSAMYIGTVDDAWKPLHSIAMKQGGTTEDLLRAIQRF